MHQIHDNLNRRILQDNYRRTILIDWLLQDSVGRKRGGCIFWWAHRQFIGSMCGQNAVEIVNCVLKINV